MVSAPPRVFPLAAVALLLAVLLWPQAAAAGGEKVAIQGYDPVAYFTEGRPVKGSAANSYEWHGSQWHFASAENRESFAADPDRYAPQYGGYCALGVAKGDRYEVDPQAWTIVAGRLYLNYDQATLAAWRDDHVAMIEKADRTWPKMAR